MSNGYAGKYKDKSANRFLIITECAFVLIGGSKGSGAWELTLTLGSLL